MDTPTPTTPCPSDRLRELLEWVLSTDIVEFSLEREGEKVSLKRSGFEALPHPERRIERIRPETPSSEAQAGQLPAQEKPKALTITSPMVGTFYRSPAPEAKPYVEVGEIIHKGQVVCIIEAMKIMNEIESDVTGRVFKVLVDDRKPVGFGTPLFELEPIPA
jgi:acetyl-CoA carboxylase biotin carboxyl carrier protein